MSIGSRIREVRKERGWSQKQLAEKVGIAQASISGLETSESYGTTYVARLAAALGVSPLWLETGKGPREPVAGEGAPTSLLELRAETAAELKLLVVYRSANERERAEIDAVIDEMSALIEARRRDQAKLAV